MTWFEIRYNFWQNICNQNVKGTTVKTSQKQFCIHNCFWIVLTVVPFNKLGFELNSQTGSCICSYLLSSLDFDGFSNNSFSLTTKHFSVKSSSCLYNREGILCGNCSTNYNVVFGSTECRRCSNWWLWTLVFYAAAGPLLIYLLYALKLTLTTSTLNGIIFYAQVVNADFLRFCLLIQDNAIGL